MGSYLGWAIIICEGRFNAAFWHAYELFFKFRAWVPRKKRNILWRTSKKNKQKKKPLLKSIRYNISLFLLAFFYNIVDSPTLSTKYVRERKK